MEKIELKDIVYTFIGNALRAADTNHIVTFANEVWDEEFVLSGETGARQSEINKYLLNHGGGGGVDPEEVIAIIEKYLHDNGYTTDEDVRAIVEEALKNVVANINSSDKSITVKQDDVNKKTDITIHHFDGGVIHIN